MRFWIIGINPMEVAMCFVDVFFTVVHKHFVLALDVW